MTINFAQGNWVNGGATSRTFITCAFPGNNTAGRLLVVSCGWADSAGTINMSSVTDSAGNTYFPAGTKTRNASQQYSLQTFYAWGVAGSANTVTFTLTASSTFLFPHVQEYSSTNGSWTSDPLDKTASGTGNGTSLLTSAVTPSVNNELVYTFGGTGGAGVVVAAGSFTLREPTSPNVTGSADLVQTTAASVQGALSSAPNSGQWGIQLATFRDAPAPSYPLAGLPFPDVGIFLSGTDPNDPNTVDLWSANLAPARTWRINQADRGRQFELDQNIEGNASADFRNVDEYLNPANPSSPLLQFAKPMRRTRMMASYPPGGTGNTVNTTAGMDPTVDSYTTGTLPGWLAAVRTAPSVQAANPHSGTKSVQYSVAGDTNPHGVVAGTAAQPLYFFPGQQYTASWWVRQTSASTQQIAVGGLTALDRFQRTGALNGSTADSGQTWSFSGGATGDYTTTAGPNPPGNGSLSIGNPTANVLRFATLSVSGQDADFRVPVKVPATATGGSYSVGLVARWADANNFYEVFCTFNTNGTVDANIAKMVGGTFTSLAAAAGAFTYTAGSQFWLRMQVTGPTLQFKVWQVGTVEPSAWTATVGDAALTAAGQVGVFGFRSTANTNSSPSFVFGPLAVTSYSTPGTTTTATGSYQRLTVTFTATQPTHTVAVTTVGTAVVGTVNLDDVQVEPGASATTFTQSGPLIRGLWGGQLADTPVTWVPGTQGFEGMMQAPFVGPLAALAQIPIHTDYITAVLRLAPAYFWPLWDPSGASTFAEISGNSGPPMQQFIDSATGNPGNTLTTFNAGVPTNIPGDPSGAGLQIFNSNEVNPGDFKWAQAGAPVGSPAIVQPTNNTGYSVAFWFAHTNNATNPGQIINGTRDDGVTGWNATIFPPNYINPGDPPKFQFNAIFPSSNSTGGGGLITDTWGDGKMHLYVVSVSTSGATGNVSVWIDGALVINDTETYTANIPAWIVQYVTLVGDLFTTPQNALFAHLALFNRPLSAAEATGLWNAGSGNPGELSGTRAGRYLGNYYTGPTVVDTGTLSPMGSPTAPESTPLIQALQRLQDTEMGNLFETRDGAVQFDGREVRWQRLTPTVVFGDGPGEIPYEESPVFGNPLTQVSNQALVTRSSGIRAVGRPDTTGSINSFYPRGYTLTVDCQTDAEAQQHADWLVLTRSQPRQRVAVITINLAANPAAFVAVINLEIGARASVKRRPKAANSGAGITMSQDYFVEKITHRQIDPELGTWYVDLQLSPVPAPQPWICGDATYGVLGQTTIPGF